MRDTSIILCVRKPNDEYLLRLSVEEHPYSSEEFIPIHGAKSAAEGLNEGVRRSKAKLLVFTHSDVKVHFSEASWNRCADELYSSGVIGVAGSRKLPANGDWAAEWPERGFGSGGCLHSKNGSIWMTNFGFYGQVAVCDGVFMAVRRKVFEEVGGFDESLGGWHFYDMDLCLRVHLAGYINKTFPLVIEHDTTNLGKTHWQEWDDCRQRFLKKWESVLPLQVTAPVLEPNEEVSVAGR